MNPFYPLFLNLKSEPVLVIGGGKVAERKVRSLLACGACVTVVSPVLTSGLSRLAEARKVSCRVRGFHPSDLKGMRLVICATNDSEVNRKAASEAEARGVLLNVVDDPELCRFIVPAVVRKGDLTIAVSTSGGSPALARKIRRRIEQEIGPEYREFLRLLKQVRPFVQRAVRDKTRRGKVYRDLVESGALERIREGSPAEARQAIRSVLGRYSIPIPKETRR